MIKQVLSMMLAGAVLFGGSAVYAGSACCPASKKAKTEAKAGKEGSCVDVLSKLNLSDEQKKKVEALRADCDKEGCSETSKVKFTKGLKEILTPEQIAACKTECEKMDKSACPFMKGDSKI
jgi:Spy/CpxP family protein refolding chaperone